MENGKILSLWEELELETHDLLRNTDTMGNVEKTVVTHLISLIVLKDFGLRNA